MPRLNDQDMEIIGVTGTPFQFSATRIDKLGATEYTLVTIVVDISGSVDSYKNDLEKCLQEIVNACRKSPRVDNLMVRLVSFNNDIDEIHGYKLFQECNPDDYKGILHCGGMTALFDATVDAINAMEAYSKSLYDNDFDCNGILFVLTDGWDNVSTYSENDVAKLLKNIISNESIESIQSILIGVNVNDPTVSSYLHNFKDKGGFTQYEEIEHADAKTLAKLADFVSRSISSQSSSLGSGTVGNQVSLTV